jgi:hypothetical protein
MEGEARRPCFSLWDRVFQSSLIDTDDAQLLILINKFLTHGNTNTFRSDSSSWVSYILICKDKQWTSSVSSADYINRSGPHAVTAPAHALHDLSSSQPHTLHRMLDSVRKGDLADLNPTLVWAQGLEVMRCQAKSHDQSTKLGQSSI